MLKRAFRRNLSGKSAKQGAIYVQTGKMSCPINIQESEGATIDYIKDFLRPSPLDGVRGMKLR
jgi:hypothetical protein